MCRKEGENTEFTFGAMRYSKKCPEGTFKSRSGNCVKGFNWG